MLSIICETLTCLQMSLGVGYIVSETSASLVYYNLATSSELLCIKSGSIMHCGTLKQHMDAWQARRYDPFLR